MPDAQSDSGTDEPADAGAYGDTEWQPHAEPDGQPNSGADRCTDCHAIAESHGVADVGPDSSADSQPDTRSCGLRAHGLRRVGSLLRAVRWWSAAAHALCCGGPGARRHQL